jgi:hypothetical protein
LINGAQLLAAVVRTLDAAHVSLTSLTLRRPTLDDVFLALTWRTTTAGDGLPVEESKPLARSTT